MAGLLQRPQPGLRGPLRFHLRLGVGGCLPALPGRPWLLRELYSFGAYTVGVMVWALESWPSKKPIRNMDDFKGLNPEPQGMEAEFMSKAGASVVVLPGTEVFSAMDKGVIDATNWATASINDKTGIHQVAPFFSYPGFHSMPVGIFTVRQADWDKHRGHEGDPDQRLPRTGRTLSRKLPWMT